MSVPWNDYPPMQPNDTFRFKCQCCGNCCRHVAKSVMVESLDLARIAEHLRLEHGEIVSRYMEVATVAWGTPILLMKTTGPDDACVFLQDNKCGIHAFKPRACRTFPLCVGPDDALSDFLIHKVSNEEQCSHGRWYRAQEWLNATFGTVDRLFIKMDYRFLREYGQIMRRLPRDRENDVLLQMLHWRFLQYDMSQSFITQYVDNMRMLKTELEKLVK